MLASVVSPRSNSLSAVAVPLPDLPPEGFQGSPSPPPGEGSAGEGREGEGEASDAGAAKLHACKNCQRSKTACNDERPCARCVRLGVPCDGEARAVKRACAACKRSKVNQASMSARRTRALNLPPSARALNLPPSACSPSPLHSGAQPLTLARRLSATWTITTRHHAAAARVWASRARRTCRIRSRRGAAASTTARTRSVPTSSHPHPHPHPQPTLTLTLAFALTLTLSQAWRSAQAPLSSSTARAPPAARRPRCPPPRRPSPRHPSAPPPPHAPSGQDRFPRATAWH